MLPATSSGIVSSTLSVPRAGCKNVIFDVYLDFLVMGFSSSALQCRIARCGKCCFNCIAVANSCVGKCSVTAELDIDLFVSYEGIK